MATIAYASNLAGGVDMEASGLAIVALDASGSLMLSQTRLTPGAQAYLKDLLAALVAVTPTPAGAPDGTSNSETSAKELLQTITKGNLLDLFETAPSCLHAPQIGSVERFMAHQHLYDLPPPALRARRLDKSLRARVAAAEDTKGARHETANAEVKEEEDGEEDGDANMEASSRHAPSLQQQAPDSGPTGWLEASLFPELPPSDKSESQGLKKAKAPIIDISSSEDEIELSKLVNTKVPKPKKEDDGDGSRGGAGEPSVRGRGKVSEVNEEPGKGRFGVWKLLSGILEANAPGPQQHHRPPHYSLQRGRSYK